MAEFLQSAGEGCQIRSIELFTKARWVPDQMDDPHGCQNPRMGDSPSLPNQIIAGLRFVHELAHAGFGSPETVVLKVIKELDEPDLSNLVHSLASAGFNPRRFPRNCPGLTLEMYRAMTVDQKMKVREDAINKLEANMLAELKHIRALHPDEVYGSATTVLPRILKYIAAWNRMHAPDP